MEASLGNEPVQKELKTMQDAHDALTRSSFANVQAARNKVRGIHSSMQSQASGAQSTLRMALKAAETTHDTIGAADTLAQLETAAKKVTGGGAAGRRAAAKKSAGGGKAAGAKRAKINLNLD